MSNVSNLKSPKRLKPNQFLLPSGVLITEHPILFQTEMIQANLADRKTQTRREINPKPESVNNNLPIPISEFNAKMDSLIKKGLVTIRTGTNGFAFPNCRYGKPGDLLWVKETWQTTFEEEQWKPIYKADGGYWIEDDGPMPWKPSIHMRKKYSRIWAMVEEIRVERVQDISEADAKAEGVLSKENHAKNGMCYFDYSGKIGAQGYNYGTAKESFKSLWISINGEDSWNANPWIWVIKYRILSKTGRPSLEVIENAYREVSANCKLGLPTGKEESHA